MLVELQRLVNAVREANWQALHERQEAEGACRLLVMEAQPTFPLRVELRWRQA